ncbi:hypothetical protein LMG19087_03002 [Ralstonia wenshanensis]|uniref:phage late control D family protein n=1 Tax=Ralstonia wenshanensis TaxID=2842456 RepID=UPI0028F53E86|nr:contractile injection system protein, VgrG/Pvc8 family [Ralstonia wenshanensis]CAJ0817153.1 hypothetical protein LMG19087_03002 [Ralstonia wenshanensis]
MEAQFEVLADGQDITALLRDRVLEIRLTDKPGMEADRCEIRLDDRDGKIAFPPKGAKLRISFGWVGKGLSTRGTYAVDEIELSGPPATIVIRGKPADMRATAKAQRNASYTDTTLAAIVASVAARHGWKPACTIEAHIDRADQFGESDLHFITRLARQYGGTATVKGGRLIVAPRGGGKSADGKPLAPIVLRPSDLMRYRLTFPDRSSVGGVRTRAHDAKTGRKVDLYIPNPEAPNGPPAQAVHTDRHVHASPQAAKAAARAKLQDMNRSTAEGELEMMGRGDISAEKTLRLEGFKAQADGDYLADTVTHIYANKSWLVNVSLNGGNSGKAKAGQGKAKKAAKVTNLVIPAPPKQ